mmetsp:Transcript_22795/g.54719  ORF Transcript_22795/g.54719 Transcript_22795/m.54719 type:complete len:129 (-) Transcript_22795:159-545(-)
MLGFKDLFNKATAAINSVQIDTALNIQTRPKSGASGPQDAVPGTDIVARYEKRWEEITANGSMLAAKVSEEDAKVTEESHGGGDAAHQERLCPRVSPKSPSDVRGCLVSKTFSTKPRLPLTACRSTQP